MSAIFSVMVVVLTTTISVMYIMGVVTLRHSDDVRRHLETIDQLQLTMSTLKDAETGQRGYLLAGEESYLEPYTSAVEAMQHYLARLQRSASESELDPADVSKLGTLIDAKLAELKQTIDLQHAQKHDAAVAIVRSDEGKRLMDDARALGQRLTTHEHAQLAAAQDASNRLTRFRTATFLGCGVINLGFLGWAYRRIRREAIGREAAAVELRRQKDLLSVTLGSIGDAVIVTDRGASITFMNPMAEQLTGWTTASATGKPCGEIFRIINESSRQTVESPVDKVLRLGQIVGLANHTLLIRKDGSEIPIDDSGAPIRDESGKVHGVVLVFRDFSEHKASERKLKSTNLELAAASQAKDQFLAALSHELRTPLTPVLATLTAWETVYAGNLPGEIRADIRMLRRNVELEARLIDDLLDLTRIIKGKMPLNVEPLDVHDLLRSVISTFGSEVQEKRIELSVRTLSTHPKIHADPARIQQIFWNLLKNAAKFTPQGGRIDIATEGQDGHVIVTFADSGIGMSAETLGRLFRPFEQGNAATVRQFGGLGMGLAISKALVDAHGGSIEASSAGEGKGASFTVRLPTGHAVADDRGAGAAPRPSDPVATGLNGSLSVESPPTAVESPKSLRIMLVEDHADTSAVLSRLLRRWGYQVAIADSVASARDLLSGNEFDLLLSDIGLPDGTGIDLIQWVRDRTSIPAIALTGFGMDDDIQRCEQAGFNAHLTKPVNFQTLETLIKNVTQISR